MRQDQNPNHSSEKIVYIHDFLQEAGANTKSTGKATKATTTKTKADIASCEESIRRRRIALGQAVWCEAFWLPTQQRKHPNYNLSIVIMPSKEEHNPGNVANVAPKLVVTSNDDDEDGKAVTTVDWNKLIQSALKKVHVEDLGDLAGSELLPSIPVEDKEGRGQNDIESIQKQLSVKLVWVFYYDPTDNHVMLVGNKTKLEKKCLSLRNILAHYYWRLKGKQINL